MEQNTMVATLINKYRKGNITKLEIAKLFKEFKSREVSIYRFLKRANGLYDSEELRSAYYTGIMQAINGKHPNGKWITDTTKKETVISKVWSHGFFYAKSFVHKVASRKLVVECPKCSIINGYHSDFCSDCGTDLNTEDKKTWEKESNINKLFSGTKDEWQESDKFDAILGGHSTEENLHNKLDVAFFINRLKNELEKRNLSSYCSIIDLLVDKRVFNSSNYLKSISGILKTSPQSINIKMRKIKEIAKLSDIKFID